VSLLFQFADVIDQIGGFPFTLNLSAGETFGRCSLTVSRTTSYDRFTAVNSTVLMSANLPAGANVQTPPIDPMSENFTPKTDQ